MEEMAGMAANGILDLEDYLGKKQDEWTREDIATVDTILGHMQRFTDDIAERNGVHRG